MTNTSDIPDWAGEEACELLCVFNDFKRYRWPVDRGASCVMRLAQHLMVKRTAFLEALPEADGLLQEVMAEVAKATEKFPTWPTRIIDAGNVVSEEAGELAKACLQVTYEKHKETLAGVRMEAIQTAAMCIRFLASMDRYDTSPGPQHSQSAE